MTEAEARAALRAFVGISDIEPWQAVAGLAMENHVRGQGADPLR